MGENGGPGGSWGMTRIHKHQEEDATVHPNRLGAFEIAALLGVSRENVDQLATTPGFPEPLDQLASGSIWSYEAVEAWAKATGRTVHENAPVKNYKAVVNGPSGVLEMITPLP
jgi:predicted DNA-binding transcriptional regulator AlpA